MIIRPGTVMDVPAIIELLRISLGESLMPKSEAFWQWKHADNPFGNSPLLLAFEEDRLIGVRAFMRWEWTREDRIYKSVRAVDTATHPQYQGKGIFSRLTLQLVDQCRAEGVDFIFNTPNHSSKPGYLKMGWRELGRMKIFVRPRLTLAGRSEDFGSRHRFSINQIPPGHGITVPSSDNSMVTHRSDYFLKWRYQDNPNISYFSFYDENKSYFVIFRLKPGRAGTEFRICELFMDMNVSLGSFRKHLRQMVSESGAAYVTFSGASFPLTAAGLKIGPVVTVRQLSDHESLSFTNWKPSLGDMEVF